MALVNLVSPPVSVTTPEILRDGINWMSLIGFTVFHMGAIAAPFFFTWPAFLTALALYWISLSPGIGMGYHRLLTHRSYKAPKWIEYVLTVCGTLALQGGPIFWVAAHRIHHQFSDKHGDPHTPQEGKWWAHILWTVVGNAGNGEQAVCQRYARDLAQDRFHVWISKYHYVPPLISGLLLYAWGGLPFLLWAGFFRVTVGLHAVWLVNSATHMWGSRRFGTRDHSRNSAWVALITFGEGWHNNHHAHPTSARHGLAWYEIDTTWMAIRLLRALHLIQSVQEASLPPAVRGLHE